ncbi:MFS transporter [Sphingomonas vulcanisoli]|nr:MFS transporter [Sphingomonas vulcanisoli]
MATVESMSPIPTDRLPTPLKIGWGFGSVGTQIVLNGQSLLLLFFFVTVLKMEPALAGTILFGAKLFDAVLAPIVGTWSDRTNSRWGRRRPFLLAGGILCAAGLFCVFNTPTANPLVLLASLMLISLGYSFFNIPYMAMPAEMTDSPIERTSIMSWRIAFVGVGTALATTLLPLVAKAGGGGKAAYGTVGVVAAVLTLIAMLITFAVTGRARATSSSGERFSFTAMIGAITSNGPFAFLLAAKLCQLIGLAAMSASILFFFKQVIGGGESMLALWSLFGNAASIASMLVWPYFSKRYGKVAVYAAAVLLYSVFGFSWLLAGPGESTLGVLIRAVGGGVFAGGLSLMGQSLLPDTMAVDFVRSGMRREGVFAGAYSFVEKASFALGPMAVGFIFQIMGFATHGVAGGDPRAVYAAVGLLSPGLYLLSILPLLGMRRSLAAYYRSPE